MRPLQVLERTQESDSPNPKTLGRYPGWRDHNFLDTSVKNCTSRSVEYAFHDHCTAILADAVGDAERAGIAATQCRFMGFMER